MSEIDASFERISEIVEQAYAAGLAAGYRRRVNRNFRRLSGSSVLICLVLLALVVL